VDVRRRDRPRSDGPTVVTGATGFAGRHLLDRLAADLGTDVVRRIRVHGPTAPNWRHGPLRVTGRGPRDTYG
jgi:uncharacterized protein YbjT (DUF2867 family)